MKNIKENKAITLIALVITIIVLLLLAGVSISMLSGQDGILNKASDAKNKTTEANRNEKDALESIEGLITEGLNSEFSSNEGVNKPKLSEGMIPIKYDEEKEKWIICSESDADWYNYTEEDKKWANIMLSDGTYSGDTATVGTEVEDSELGSMFVWIPRYAYSINEYKVAKDGEGTSQKITNVSFLVGTTNMDSEGNNYPTDYNVDEQEVGKATPMIVHPAFKFGEINITGFWSAKFETSMAEENLNTAENNNVTDKTVKILPNKESWRYINVGNCLTNCLEMNDDENPYGLTSSADSHLMKNNEWGATAYLSTSQYGITATTNTSCSSYTETIQGETITKYHVYTAGGKTVGDYKKDSVLKQSTTGNATGIYDLNGGAWEYVAGYHANRSSSLMTYGTDTYFNSENNLKSEYEKYWNRYEVSEHEIEYAKSTANLWNKDKTYNSERKRITDLRYELMKNIKGDAMYEVIKEDEYSYYGKNSNDNHVWLVDENDTIADYGETYYNGDYSLIGNCLLHFLQRGGSWNDQSGTGILTSRGHFGYMIYDCGFRPVILVH